MIREGGRTGGLGAQGSPDGRAVDAARRAFPGRTTHKVSHLLAADLRRQILSGELAADEQLPSEADLIGQLRVSRDTLREALRILESQSLLEMRRGRGGGAVVRQPGLESVGRYVALLLQLRKATLAHLEEVRSVVEPPAAEQLALRAGAADIDRLVQLHDAERAAEDDVLLFVTAVAAFDQAVTEMSGNRTLSVVAGVFRDIYAGQAFAAIGSMDRTATEQIARRVVVSHSAFLDAARRRDGALARQTWSDYLFTTSRMLVSRSRSQQPIDMTPLWRARAKTGSDPAPRRAIAVATEVRARIAESQLREGDRLPSLADLAAEFEISRPTLREALRILEMEFLLDLRGGDRAGARIRTPSTQVAAQLAGIVLEARQTTLADFHRALQLIEPAMIEVVAARIGTRALKQIQDLEAEMAESIEDTSRFVITWDAASALTFAATRNPALTVAAEILQWVRVGVLPAIAADAKGLPGVVTTSRKAHALFSDLIVAMADHDTVGAREIWAACQDMNMQYAEASALTERLVVDLLD